MGIKGAAIASVATQFITNFILSFLIKPIRKNNVLIIKAFNPRIAYKMFLEVKLSVVNKITGGK